MSVFTTVTKEELERWLGRYALGKLIDLQGIAAGIENTNYFVTTANGRYVLTLFEKLQAHELPFYLNLMAHLARAGVPCPAPIANRDGSYLGELNGKPASLVSRLEGKDLSKPCSNDCAQVGDVLARIHVAGESYAGHMDNPRGPQWWSAAQADVLPFLDTDNAALLRETIAMHAQHDFSALPRGAVHADLFRDNILFLHGKISGVIDFYFACTDFWLYDVAITVNDWCLRSDGTLDDVLARTLLNAYHAVRPFTDTEHGAWPALLRAGALRFWVSRLYDFHLPRAGELTHAKDPAHFERLLRSYVKHQAAIPPLPA